MGCCRNRTKTSVLLCAVACVPLLHGHAFSQVTGLPVSIPTVPVGYASNPSDPDNGNGSVGYQYNMGTYDVTANQYCAFLNAVASSGDPYGIYHPSMASAGSGGPGIVQAPNSSGKMTYTVIDGRGNYPVTWVDFWNSTRFVNWLDNGEPIAPEGRGTTETGSYDLIDTSYDSSIATSNSKNFVQSSDADNFAVTRSANASWALPTQNEFYKAAFFDPTRNQPLVDGGNYWDYPIRCDQMNTSQGNFSGADTTQVGSYPYSSYFGTYDQAGDVYEWLENVAVDPTSGQPINARVQRGGAYDLGGDLGAGASFESNYSQPYICNSAWGFRVVQLNTFAPGALLNLSNKFMILPSPPAGALATMQSQLQSGYNGGAWNGTSGIFSSTAAADTSHLTAVGYMINDTGANTGRSTGNAIYSTLQGSSTADGDILVMYTYYGDANLSGSIDGSDYSLIDNGYTRHLTGWYNGDFNYDGVVDGSDYTLIDNAYYMQGANLLGQIAAPTTLLANSSVVPEPAMATALATSLGICRLALRKRWRPRSQGCLLTGNVAWSGDDFHNQSALMTPVLLHTPVDNV